MSSPPPPDDPGDRVRVVVGDTTGLLARATRAPAPTELVVTPEQLHRRNLKRRLAERRQPRSSFRLVDATAVADAVLATADVQPTPLDRIDRIQRLETLVGAGVGNRLEPFFGTSLRAHLPAIEAARARVETMTGWREARLDALDATAASLPGVVADDAADLVAGVTDLETSLRETVGSTHARGGLLEAAARAVHESEGAAWEAAFTTVDRLTVAGVSTLDAPLVDLLDAVVHGTETTVTLSLRPGTGPRIADRLPALLSGREAPTVAESKTTSSAVPATELVTETPGDEARVAMAVVAALVSRGVSPGDVLVAARDADAVERQLRRAAARHGLPVAVWTQLPVQETQPYRLFRALGVLLSGDAFDADSLVRPLALGWVPPELGSSDSTIRAAGKWPTPQPHVERLRNRLLGDDVGDDVHTRPLAEWETHLEARVSAGDLSTPDAAPLERLLDWAADQPSTPAPADVHRTFEPLVAAYREVVLPAALADDTDDLQATARHARAVVRWEQLLGDVRAKYDDWLDAGYLDRSWTAVLDLADRIVATRPGRREHANAAAVDVVDATDAWLRSAPYVVAVGLVDGTWPQHPTGVFPTAFRAAVVDSDTTEARRLAVPGRWTAARELDHLWSAADAATEHVVCTRHRHRSDGTRAERSPFLDRVDATRPGEDAVSRLLHEGTLPGALGAGPGGGSS